LSAARRASRDCSAAEARRGTNRARTEKTITRDVRKSQGLESLNFISSYFLFIFYLGMRRKNSRKTPVARVRGSRLSVRRAEKVMRPAKMAFVAPVQTTAYLQYLQR